MGKETFGGTGSSPEREGNAKQEELMEMLVKVQEVFAILQHLEKAELSAVLTSHLMKVNPTTYDWYEKVRSVYPKKGMYYSLTTAAEFVIRSLIRIRRGEDLE